MKEISSGVVHDLPRDLKDLLITTPGLLPLWENLTPLARNEWICWIEEAKKPETRSRRMSRLSEELPEGKKRPCCWPGCPHRKK